MRTDGQEDGAEKYQYALNVKKHNQRLLLSTHTLQDMEKEQLSRSFHYLFFSKKVLFTV